MADRCKVNPDQDPIGKVGLKKYCGRDQRNIIKLKVYVLKRSETQVTNFSKKIKLFQYSLLKDNKKKFLNDIFEYLQVDFDNSSLKYLDKHLRTTIKEDGAFIRVTPLTQVNLLYYHLAKIIPKKLK